MAGEGPDIGMQMAQWAARMQGQGAGGGKQGPLDGAILKGAAAFTPTNAAPLAKNLPSFNGTGRGMCGGMADSLMNAMQQCGDAFLKSLANTGIQAPQIGGNIFEGNGLPRNVGGGAGGPDL